MKVPSARRYLPKQPVKCDNCKKDVGMFCIYITGLKDFLCFGCYSKAINEIWQSIKIQANGTKGKIEVTSKERKLKGVGMYSYIHEDRDKLTKKGERSLRRDS